MIPFAEQVATLLRATELRAALAAAGPADAARWSVPALARRALDAYRQLAEAARAGAAQTPTYFRRGM